MLLAAGDGLVSAGRTCVNLVSLAVGVLLLLQPALAKDNGSTLFAQNADRKAANCRHLAGKYYLIGQDVPGASTHFQGARFRFDELFGPVLPRDARNDLTTVVIKPVGSDRFEVEYVREDGFVLERTMIPPEGARSSCGLGGFTFFRTAAARGEAVSGVNDVTTTLRVDETGQLEVRQEIREVSSSTLGIPLPVSPVPRIQVTKFFRTKEQ